VEADENVLPAIVEAVKVQATMGEIMRVFKAEYGTYRETQ
jgi:methylmalonyl-CoA mutase N-terminal domain/subunit